MRSVPLRFADDRGRYNACCWNLQTYQQSRRSAAWSANVLHLETCAPLRSTRYVYAQKGIEPPVSLIVDQSSWKHRTLKYCLRLSLVINCIRFALQPLVCLRTIKEMIQNITSRVFLTEGKTFQAPIPSQHRHRTQEPISTTDSVLAAKPLSQLLSL